MNIIYITLSIGLLFWVLFKYYKKRKNELLALELQSIYDKIEIDFISNENNNMSNEEIDFLRAYKRIANNSYLLDIRLIIVALKEQQSDHANMGRSKHIEAIVAKQSQEFNGLLDQFHRVSLRKVKMSFFNSGFLWICLVVFLQSIVARNTDTIRRRLNLKTVMQVLSPTGMGYMKSQTC